MLTPKEFWQIVKKNPSLALAGLGTGMILGHFAIILLWELW